LQIFIFFLVAFLALLFLALFVGGLLLGIPF